MNIILRELRAHLKGFIIWSVCIFLFVLSMISEFSAYYHNPEMTEILEVIPQNMLDAFSISGTNLTTVSGYVSIAAVYFVLMLSVYAGLLGASIISKEERDKTAEFLMTLPISRVKVISEKIIASFILALGMNLVVIGCILAMTIQFEKLDYFGKYMVLFSLSMFIIELVFMTIGMALASVMKRYKRSGSLTIGVIIIMYILSILMSFTDKLDHLKFLTVFKYFEPAEILHKLSLNGGYMLLSIGLIVVMIIVTYLVYPRRDLHI